MDFNGISLLQETDLFFDQTLLDLTLIPVSELTPVCELRVAKRSPRSLQSRGTAELQPAPQGSPTSPRLSPILKTWTPKESKKKTGKRPSAIRICSVTNPDPNQKPIVLYKDYYFDVVLSDGMISRPFIVAINGAYNSLSPNRQIVYVQAGPNIVCDLQSNCGWQRSLVKNSFKLRLRKINPVDNSLTKLEIKTGYWVNDEFVPENHWTVPITLYSKKKEHVVLKLI